MEREREDRCACNLRQTDPAAARILRIQRLQRLKVRPGTLDIHIGGQFGTDDGEKEMERERERCDCGYVDHAHQVAHILR